MATILSKDVLKRKKVTLICDRWGWPVVMFPNIKYCEAYLKLHKSTSVSVISVYDFLYKSAPSKIEYWNEFKRFWPKTFTINDDVEERFFFFDGDLNLITSTDEEDCKSKLYAFSGKDSSYEAWLAACDRISGETFKRNRCAGKYYVSRSPAIKDYYPPDKHISTRLLKANGTWGDKIFVWEEYPFYIILFNLLKQKYSKK